MLQEISRTQVIVYRNEEVMISWHNSVLTISTEKEIYFTELTHNLQCLDKKIDLASCSIVVSKSSPLTGHIPNHFLGEKVRNIDYTEMILDPALWPHNPNMVNEMTNIADFQWSPAGFLPGNRSAIAVLNNIGNVDIYMKGRYDYTNILNLSNFIQQRYFTSGNRKTPKTIEQLAELAYTLETSAICWAPKCDNTSNLFATAQKNGKILFWLLSYQSCLEKEFLNEIETEIGEAITMLWVPKIGKEFLLICSNIQGQIFALDCLVSDDNHQVQVKNQSIIWEQKDKMVTKHICFNNINDKIVLLCNKHRHLIVIVIDHNCQVLKRLFRNVNDHKITDIKSNEHGNWLTTVNSKIYQVILKGYETDLDFDLTLEESNDSYSTLDMYGVAFSNNNIIWTVALKTKKIFKRQRSHKKVEIVFLYKTNNNPDELTLLLQNNTKKLTDFWDCIEVLRYKTLKTKTITSLDYKALYEESNTDIYKLKLYHVFLNFLLSLEKLVRNYERIVLPEMSLDTVKEKILVLHAAQLVNEAHKSKANSREALDTYQGAKRYIDYYCEKYKRHVQEFINTGNKLEVPKSEKKIICQCCDEIIDGFTCKSGHFNMFCSLTFTPIDNYDYLVCENCNATVRPDLCSKNPICVFCDLYLNSFNLI